MLHQPIQTPHFRPKHARKSRGYCIGIGGKDATDADPNLWEQHLFLRIVQNTANTTEKRLMVASAFINMKTRGRAVSIDPLEYCGNGIPLNTTHRGVVV